MKKIILLACLCAVSLFAQSQDRADQQHLSNPDSFSMILLGDPQGGGWEGNGGDGWLRILEFLPDGKTVKVSTYSPLFGISPATKHLAHRTGDIDQFDMIIE